MPLRREIRALAAFAVLGWRSAAAAPLAAAGRALLYLVVLAIFWQLWRATPLGELGPNAPSAADLLWYLAITEWIVFTGGIAYREVERDILSGEIAAALQRPLPYAAATLARWAGSAAFHLIVLAAVGIATTLWLAGAPPLPAVILPAVAVSGVLATILILLCHLQLGYAAAWLGASAPPFWIWQKLTFVLGGLLIPLTLYPAPWGRIAAATPFAAMLFGPGSLALDATLPNAASVLLSQLLWLVLIGGLTLWIDRRAAMLFLRRGI
jgi:ABC-2 type transport system permease protein